MMMIIITRYPASEDRLIVRPLLSRVCALRLPPSHLINLTKCEGGQQMRYCERKQHPAVRHGGHGMVGVPTLAPENFPEGNLHLTIPLIGTRRL